jgi:hypothetical protein
MTYVQTYTYVPVWHVCTDVFICTYLNMSLSICVHTPMGEEGGGPNTNTHTRTHTRPQPWCACQRARARAPMCDTCHTVCHTSPCVSWLFLFNSFSLTISFFPLPHVYIHIANMCQYMYIIVLLCFLSSPPKFCSDLCVYIYMRVCIYSVCISRDVRMQMHVLVYTDTSRHASMCMHVCMCALLTAAWPTPDPSYATGRADCSFPIRHERAQGHGACAAAGGRDCRRQKQGTGRPTHIDVGFRL